MGTMEMQEFGAENLTLELTGTVTPGAPIYQLGAGYVTFWPPHCGCETGDGHLFPGSVLVAVFLSRILNFQAVGRL